MMAMDVNGHPQAFGAGKLAQWRVDTSLVSEPRSLTGAGTPIELEPALTRESPTSVILAFGDSSDAPALADKPLPINPHDLTQHS